MKDNDKRQDEKKVNQPQGSPEAPSRRVVLLNFSGNVGKTTLATQLFAPRMPGAPYYAIESINMGAEAAGLQVIKLRGEQHRLLLHDLYTLSEVIVDVGASNVEAFMLMMQKYKSADMFDLYVVPIGKDNKQMVDSLHTIAALNALSIPAAKIKVVFNKVGDHDDVDTLFAPVYGAHSANPTFTIPKKAVIYYSDAFEDVRLFDKTLSQVLADPTDYAVAMRTAKTPAERESAFSMLMLKKLADTAVENLNAVYKSLAA